ncbi:MAG TPA: 3-deoxy-manno-octulosonate cytidylyltransferase [candidate division Zixibacteria bacterium]
MKKIKVAGIIPARFASARMPGKPLRSVWGEPLIQRVYQQARKSAFIDKLLVATDDHRIMDAVFGFGGEAVLTSAKHKSGTDRAGEAADKLNCDLVVNIQCDQPFLNPKMLDQLISYMLKNKKIYMATLAQRINQKKDLSDPNVVKVVMDRNGYALYFSRSLLPYSKAENRTYYKHAGIYGFRKDFLAKYAKLAQTPLEKSEKLEQLRVLENGYKIKVLISKYNSLSIDTPLQLKEINHKSSTSSRDESALKRRRN